jgi:ATP-dependent protease HslVU (ClpYQ) peptidase subunit
VTAIVALVRDGAVHIGGDSAASDGYSLSVRADSKVFTNGPFVFGFTGSFRMGQLIRYTLRPPQPGIGLHEFMCTTFIDALRDCLKRGGYAAKEDEQESGGTFLVGVNSRLFVVEDDYQVGETVDGYAAVGSGAELALGALYATEGTDLDARGRLGIALRAAERFSPNVCRPFSFAST